MVTRLVLAFLSLAFAARTRTVLTVQRLAAFFLAPLRAEAPFTAEAAEATALVVCAVWPTLPKSVVYVAPQDGSPGVPGTMPMPTSVKSGSRMLWRGAPPFLPPHAVLRGGGGGARAPPGVSPAEQTPPGLVLTAGGGGARAPPA